MFYGVTFFNKNQSIHHPQEYDYSNTKCKEVSLVKNYLTNFIYCSLPLNTYSHYCVL